MDLVRWVMEGFGDWPVSIVECYAEKIQLRCRIRYESDARGRVDKCFGKLQISCKNI